MLTGAGCFSGMTGTVRGKCAWPFGTCRGWQYTEVLRLVLQNNAASMLFKGWSVLLLLLLLLLLQWLAPEKLRGCGAILVNSKGQRFVDELTTRDKVTEAIMKQVSPQCAIRACDVLHLLPGLAWGVLVWLVGRCWGLACWRRQQWAVFSQCGCALPQPQDSVLWHAVLRAELLQVWCLAVL